MDAITCTIPAASASLGSTPRPMRTLLAYCVLADKLRTPGAGLLQSLTPFFAEVCRQFAGEVFDAGKFTDALAARFGMRMPRLAALGLSDQLAQEGLLTALSSSGAAQKFYRYVDTMPPVAAEEVSPVTESEVEAVTAAFIACCRADERLAAWSDIELESAFMDRLVNLDSMRLLGRRESLITPRKSAATLQLVGAPAPAQPDRDDLHLDFLVSQFLLDLKDNNPAGFERASNIAFANMAAEALACFREPAGSSSLNGLTVYLDSPLLLDMLGVNPEYSDYGNELLAAIKASGATAAVFDHCVAEAESAIHAQLNHQRSGVNGLSMHWGTRAAPDLLSALIGNVGARATQRLGIAVHQDPVSNLLRISAPTVGSIEASMTARMQNWRNEDAKEYDRKSVWAMLNLREGLVPSPRICDAKFMLLTRNTALVGIANDAWNTWTTQSKHRKFNRPGAPNWMPVAMSDKQFAGYLWMRTGGAEGSISKARLLAHCSAAVRPRSDIKTRVYNLVLDLSSNQQGSEDVVALLDDREGERALMRVTRGDPEDVTAERLPFILESVKLAAGEFAAERARAEGQLLLEETRVKHEETLAQVREVLESARVAEAQKAQAAEAALRQQQMDQQSLAGQLADTQKQLAENERAAQQRQQAILQAGLAAGTRRFTRWRWGSALTFGLGMSGTVLLGEGYLQFAAGLTGVLGVVGYGVVPEYLERPLHWLAMRRLREVVSVKDATLCLPAPAPNFKSGTWAALPLVALPPPKA